MSKYDIITIGDASEDIFIRPRDLKVVNDTRFVTGRGATFELGEKIILDDVEYEIGGSACNNAVAFSRQGYNAATFLAIGNDTPGGKILERLRDENVSDRFVIQRQSFKTNFSVIFNIQDERTIFVYHGMEDYSCLKPPGSLNTKWIFIAPLGSESECVIDAAVTLAAEKNIRIAWNPGGFQIQRGARAYKHLLSCTKILFLNREEAIKFVNFPVIPDTKKLLENLADFGVKIVVMTDGKKGAHIFYNGEIFRADALSQERVDATGAGDSFASGFTGRIMQSDAWCREDVFEAIKWAVINSTSVVGKIGAQKGLLTKSEILKRVQELNLKIEII